MTTTAKLSLLLAILDLAPQIEKDILDIDKINTKILEMHWEQIELFNDNILRQSSKNSHEFTSISE